MKKLVLCLMIPFMTGCAENALKFIPPKPSPACAGWERIRLKPETSLYLAKSDIPAMIDIDAHNLKGRNLNCW